MRCRSPQIIVKFNKSGHFNFLFKGNINDESLPCYTVQKHTPNSIYINDGIVQSERLVRLNKIAISQMKILTETNKKLLSDMS